jgi:hypothetical protein
MGLDWIPSEDPYLLHKLHKHARPLQHEWRRGITLPEHADGIEPIEHEIAACLSQLSQTGGQHIAIVFMTYFEVRISHTAPKIHKSCLYAGRRLKSKLPGKSKYPAALYRHPN